MKLVGSTTSAYVRKVHILLLEKQLPFSFEKDSPWEPGNHVADLNPLGKVPCLIADDGEVWFDSPILAEYVDSLSASPRFVPAGLRDALRVRQWQSLCDGLLDAGSAIFLEENRRPEDKRWPDWIARQEAKLVRGFDALERGLAGRQWLHGETMTLADIAAGCALGWVDFRLPRLGWRNGRPALAAHFERLASRPSFAATVPAV